MRTVAPPLVLGLVLSALLAWYARNKAAPLAGGRVMAVAFVLPFVAAGFGETYGSTQIAALGALLFACAFQKRTLRLPLTALVGALAGFAIVAVAPGNFVRQSFFPPPPPLPITAGIAVSSISAFLRELAGQNAIGLLVIPAAGALLAVAFPASSPRRVGGRTEVFLLASVGVCLLAGFAIAAYSVSNTLPERRESSRRSSWSCTCAVSVMRLRTT